MRILVNSCAVAALMTNLLAAAATAAEPVDALMLRFPAVSASHIAFCYANDLWLVPRSGGMAQPLSSPSGRETNPRFSPDGTQIAFSGNYDGSVDVYSLPVAGGIPRRHTFEPGNETVQHWLEDGRIVFSAASHSDPNFGQSLYYATDGGIPQALPLVFADQASFSADGRRVAFTPWSTEHRTWNRYQGGLASDIWVYDLDKQTAQQITDWPGTDACPMFVGERVYYISDAGPEHRRNIWYYDLASGERAQVTQFAAHETKYPSAGPDCIVLENGGKLYLLSLPGHELSEVRVQLPGDRKALRPKLVDAGELVRASSLSPNAKRLAVEARGDVWTIPVENGIPLNLTRSDGNYERSPAWSPDGQSVAYFSEASGEYELYVRPADGSGEPKQLTSGSKQFYTNIRWSPDSKQLCFNSKSGQLLLIKAEGGEAIVVDTDPWAGGISPSWSPDSNWLAYSISDAPTATDYIRLYNIKEAKHHNVTSPLFESNRPVFDLSGDYLYFTTERNLNLRFSEAFDSTFVFTDASYPAVIPLRNDLKSPWAAENDAEEMKAEKPDTEPKDATAKADGEDKSGDTENEASKDKAENKDKGKDGEDKPDPSKETKIDLDGMEARALPLPVARSRYGGLAAGKGSLFYTRDAGDGWNLYRYHLKDKKEELVLASVGSFALSKDASKALVNHRGNWYVIEARPGAKAEKAINSTGLITEINPRNEWRQMINDVYRIQRDYFYDAGLHGVDWAAVRDRALAQVELAAVREDVTYIIAEMVSELNAGHTYVFGGTPDSGGNNNTGSLGCQFEVAADSAGINGVRIARIFQPGDWELDHRNPLLQPGSNVSEGEFLLAINGVAVRPEQSPYALLQGTAGKTVELTVGPSATRDGKERKVLVNTSGWDSELRLRAWIEAKRRWVDEQSGGRVGYIYVRSTGGPGLTDLVRQFNGQYMKDALIIDERWNGGGMIPDRFIELLNRPIRSYWAKRDGQSWRTPQRSHAGPKVMLINGHAGSGGDAFPYYFRQAGLGKLVGTRTWGGLIGISGNPGLIDGSGITVPTFGIFEADGTWAIEGYGVDPDIEVINDPASLAAGRDLQLEKALEVALAELEVRPYSPPVKPASPDRSGAGIPLEER